MSSESRARPGIAWIVAVGAMILASPMLFAALEDSRATSFWALGVAAVWFIAGSIICRLHRSRLEDRVPQGQAVWTSLITGAVLAVASFVGGLVLATIPATRGWVQGPLYAAEQQNLLVLVAVGLAAGTAEEVFFRVGLPRLLSGWRLWVIPTVAYAATTAFTASLGLVTMAVILGLVATWVTVKTGRWYAPIIVHALWTVTMIGVFPLVAG